MRFGTKKQKAAAKKGLYKKRLFFIRIFILLIVLFIGTRYHRSFQDLQNKSDWAKDLRVLRRAPGQLPSIWSY